MSRCRGCGKPVLELKGQFANLDSFYLSDGGPPAETAGQWHSLCLAESSVAYAWSQVRVANFRDVRGYRLRDQLPAWTILESPRTRELIAFGHDGRLLSLSLGGKSKARRVDGGAVYPVEVPEYNVKLEITPPNEALIANIQEALSSTKEYPLVTLVAELGISDRIMHPVAIERGSLKFERSLRRHWGRHTVSVRVEHGVFIPSELDAHVAPKAGQ
jgi:hypothetical protein